jgi:hypothetical protein
MCPLNLISLLGSSGTCPLEESLLEGPLERVPWKWSRGCRPPYRFLLGFLWKKFPGRDPLERVPRRMSMVLDMV